MFSAILEKAYGLFAFIYMLWQLASKLPNADCGILLIRSETVSLAVSLSRLVREAGLFRLTRGSFAR